MPKILIPTPLRQYAGNRSEVDLGGSTVAELLEALARQHGELRRHLYSDQGKLRSFINIYVNDEDIRQLDKEATQVRDGDTISIIPSIAGGADAPPGHVAPSGGAHTAAGPMSTPGVIIAAVSKVPFGVSYEHSAAVNGPSSGASFGISLSEKLRMSEHPGRHASATRAKPDSRAMRPPYPWRAKNVKYSGALSSSRRLDRNDC